MRIINRIVILMTLILLSGCMMQDGNNDNRSAMYDTQETYNHTQTISYDASATIETKNYDKDVETILTELNRQEGIIKAKMSYRYYNYVTDYEGPALDVTVNIPIEHFQDYLTYLQTHYQVQDFIITSEDIGNSIDDISETLEILQKRLADIEKKLSETNLSFTERETLEAQKRELEDQIKQSEDTETNQLESVKYAKLSITIQNVDYYKNEQLPFWLPMTKVFSQFFMYLGYSIMLSLVLVPVLLTGGIVYLIIRKKEYQMLHKLRQKEEDK